jgi:hypothetical protein
MSEVTIIFISSMNNVGMEVLSIFLAMHNEGMSNKISRVEDMNIGGRDRTISGRVIRILTRVMVQFDNRINKVLINEIKPKVRMCWIQGRVEVGAIQDLLGIIGKDPVCHSMSNMLSNTNKVGSTFTCVRGEVRVI